MDQAAELMPRWGALLAERWGVLLGVVSTALNRKSGQWGVGRVEEGTGRRLNVDVPTSAKIAVPIVLNLKTWVCSQTSRI